MTQTHDFFEKLTSKETKVDTLESKGFIKGSYLEQSDYTWDDLRVPMESLGKGGVNDPNFDKFLDNGSSSTGIYTYLFDKASEEELFFVVQLPHRYKQGTNLHPHVHWSPVSTGASGKKVCWGLEYSFAELSSVFGNTTIIHGDVVSNGDVILVANKHYLTELTEIDLSVVDSVSSMIICRLFRDATGTLGTDDYDDDAALLEFDFHYQVDYPGGSRQEYIK